MLIGCRECVKVPRMDQYQIAFGVEQKGSRVFRRKSSVCGLQSPGGVCPPDRMNGSSTSTEAVLQKRGNTPWNMASLPIRSRRCGTSHICFKKMHK